MVLIPRSPMALIAPTDLRRHETRRRCEELLLRGHLLTSFGGKLNSVDAARQASSAHTESVSRSATLPAVLSQGHGVNGPRPSLQCLKPYMP